MDNGQKPAGTKGVRRLLKAFGYSMEGLKSAFVNEEAFRLESLILVIGVPLALWLPRIGWHYRLELIGAILLLMVVELLNSGLEAIVDKASPEIHPLAKRAKDMGSAAVFIAVVINLLFWGGAFWVSAGF